MRDLIVAGIAFGSVPFIFKRPYFGLLAWVWISLMNPHRLAYGFAYDMPFAQVIGACTLVSMFVHARELYKFPVNGVTVSLICFVLWVGVSSIFAINPGGEFPAWLVIVKVQVMVLASLFLVGNREELLKLVGIMAFSIGFYGIKGGIFTIATGGGHRVWGPEGSVIEDNNAMAIANLMTVPLIRYVQLQVSKPWFKHACSFGMLASVAAALGSQSRGALLALIAMGIFFWIKSRNKLVIGFVILLLSPLMLLVLPESWYERMDTIKSYERDESALGRINAWVMAWNLAIDRFPIGGGREIYVPAVFARYAPEPGLIQGAHSIYFQMLGEHGFAGLFIFLSLFGSAWFCGASVIRQVRGRADLLWANDLATMCQVSLIAFLVGGAFLYLGYWDYPYYIVVILVALREVVRKTISEEPAAQRGQAAPSQRLGVQRT